MSTYLSDPLKGAPVAVLDFETTSPDPLTCHPVSVAVVHVDLGVSAPELVMHQLIRPPEPIPEEASAIHGIYDADVAAAPPMEKLLSELLGHLDGRVLAAFNLPYDWRILHRHVGGIAGGELVDTYPFFGLCGYVMARAVDKYERGKKLGDIAARRGIKFGAHDASEDTLATARLLPILLGELGRGKTRQDRYGRTHHDGPWCRPEDLQTIGAYWEWQVQAARRQEADFAAYRQRQGQDAPTMPWTELTGGVR